MKSIIFTAPSSGSGKTLITLGVIRNLKNRGGLDIRAFKTGPDFLDTKYLTEASGKKSGGEFRHSYDGGENWFKYSFSHEQRRIRHSGRCHGLF